MEEAKFEDSDPILGLSFSIVSCGKRMWRGLAWISMDELDRWMLQKGEGGLKRYKQYARQ